MNFRERIELLEKSHREGLVPKKVRVKRGNKEFTRTQWVRPEEVEPMDKPKPIVKEINVGGYKLDLGRKFKRVSEKYVEYQAALNKLQRIVGELGENIKYILEDSKGARKSLEGRKIPNYIVISDSGKAWRIQYGQTSPLGNLIDEAKRMGEELKS